MRRRDVAASIAIGLGLLGFIFLFGYGPAHPIGNAIERTMTLAWPIGVLATVASIMLGDRGRPAWLVRLLGYVGVAWLAFVVSYGLIWGGLIVLIAMNGGIGY